MNSKKKSISEQSKISMMGNLKIAIRAFQAIDQEIEFTRNFDKFVNEALKSKKEWISQHDIFYIFYDAIASRKNETATALNEDASAIDFSEDKYNLSESQIDFACKEIILKIESIPKEYNVKFPLPQVKIDEDLFLTKDISIVAARKFKDSLFEVNSPTFINIKTYGYITNSRDQSSMKDATSKLKQIIQIAVAKNVLKKGMNITSHNFLIFHRAF